MKELSIINCDSKNYVTVILNFIIESTMVLIYNKNIYCHNDNKHYWERIDSAKESIKIRDFLNIESQVYVSTYVINEVIGRLKQIPKLQFDFDLYIKTDFINLKNGVFEIRTKKVIKYKKEDYFTYVVNACYEEITVHSMKPRTFHEFISSSLGNCEEKRKLLLQIIGYVISDLEGAKKAFFFIGESNSGKSVLLELVRYVMGEDFITNIPFSNISDHFSAAELLKSRVNLCSEVSSVRINNADFIKSAISGDRIFADQKGKGGVYFNMRTKFLSAGNTLPVFKSVDGTDSVSNRFCILRFNRSIREKDLNLLNKLKQEADLIISEALCELTTLVANNLIFVEPNDSKKSLVEYSLNMNSFQDFINTCCSFSNDYKVHKTKLWECYQNYCTNNGLETLITLPQFNQKVLALENVTSSKFRINGQALAGWIGIGLRTSEE